MRRCVHVSVMVCSVLAMTGRPSLAANLVVNPAFQAGNSGFSSAYGVVSGANACFPEGVYAIVTDPAACHSFWASFGDHTTGTGNMMVINGAPVAGVGVWSETLNVVPNTQYYLSAWVSSVFKDNPAQLNFSINSVAIGSVFNASGTTGVWQLFFAPWFSGATTSAAISIVNQNTAQLGNDFALDDISLDTQRPAGGTDTTPVPEPATLTLLGSALAGALVRARQRRRA